MSGVRTYNKNRTRYNLVLGTPFIFGNSVNVNMSGNLDPMQKINFSRSMLQFVIEADGAPDNFQLEIKLPLLGWIRQVNLNYNSKTNIPYNESSMNRRGLVGNLLALTENSLGKTEDVARLHMLILPIVKGKKFTASLPLKYIYDVFFPDKWLDMQSGTFNIDFYSQEQIFNFPANYNGRMSCTSASLLYDVAEVAEDTDPFWTTPDSRRVYTQNFSVKSGSQQITLNLTPPGRLLWLMFFFTKSPPASSSAANYTRYLYNGWDNSLPSYMQLQNASSRAWPPSPAFIVDNNTTSAFYDPLFGADRFYGDYLSVASLVADYNNTYITYDRWLSDYRIYAIECSDDTMAYGTYTINIAMNKASPDDVEITMFGVYIDSSMGNAQYATL